MVLPMHSRGVPLGMIYLDADAEAAATDLAFGLQLALDVVRQIDRNREGQAHRAAGSGKYLRIDAHYLFDTPEKQIEVWVHPQSIIHGAVWFTDNTCLAQLNKPDMRASIGFSLSYPERLSQVIPKLSLSEMARLEFQEPDEARFPCLRLAREALRHGETALVYLNATNEIAVQAFLDRKILFPDIPSLIERVLTQVKDQKLTHLSQIYEWDKQARELATGIIQG
jgi:1-deoxy-D-xylulose-5-phosphate reductoisomerase